MRTIAHISDLHFGTEDPVVAEALLKDLAQVQPALVAVSGDLTQRARRAQFAAAREFLLRIPFPQLVVPGNHDIPLYDLGRRFFRPLHRYRRYITADLSPVFTDAEMVVLGINTARSATWKNGRISHQQIEEVHAHLCGAANVFRIVVTHHPFIPPPHAATEALVGRGPLALQSLAECGADLLLAGHLHVGYTGDVRTYHVAVKRSILVAQASTAISTRFRGEPNAYNLISIEPHRVAIQVRTWDGKCFAPSLVTRYAKIADAWERE